MTSPQPDSPTSAPADGPSNPQDSSRNERSERRFVTIVMGGLLLTVLFTNRLYPFSANRACSHKPLNCTVYDVYDADGAQLDAARFKLDTRDRFSPLGDFSGTAPQVSRQLAHSRVVQGRAGKQEVIDYVQAHYPTENAPHRVFVVQKVIGSPDRQRVGIIYARGIHVPHPARP